MFRNKGRAFAAIFVSASCLLILEAARADDPREGGAPLYCSEKVPYSQTKPDGSDSRNWGNWMDDCYRAYAVLGEVRHPKEFCEKSWNELDDVRLMTQDEFTRMCLDPGNFNPHFRGW